VLGALHPDAGQAMVDFRAFFAREHQTP
jgi:hypothetical protein